LDCGSAVVVREACVIAAVTTWVSMAYQAASAPVSARPLTTTAFEPTSGVSNQATAPVVTSETSCPSISPAKGP
jgi:hypothetical protein